MSTATGEKVLRYEAFLNDQLKPDLKAILEKRDKGCILFALSKIYLQFVVQGRAKLIELS